MKKTKIFVVCMILVVTLAGCNGGSNKNKSSKEVETSQATEPVMTEKDKKVVTGLLEDVADTELDRTENEMELVTLANRWITELDKITIDVNEVKNITTNFLATEEITEVINFKEVFPKLNNYAIGLINEDANTLGLLEGAGEKLDEDILSETHWAEVYEVILAEINK